VFRHRYNSALYVNLYSGSDWAASSWGGWSDFDGLVHGYSCAYYAAINQPIGIDCGVTGLVNSGFWTNVFNGTSWGGWVQQGHRHLYRQSGLFRSRQDSVASGTPRLCVVVQAERKSRKHHRP